MSNYKKRSQSLMDEISENLKRTIKKYNEIDMENDLSIIHSVENEESKSNALQESAKFEKERERERSYDNKSTGGNIVSNTKKVIENPRIHTNVSYSANLDNNPFGSFPSSPVVNYKPTNFSGKVNRITESMDQLSSNINKDFQEIEDMIENMIEKELKNVLR